MENKSEKVVFISPGARKVLAARARDGATFDRLPGEFRSLAEENARHSTALKELNRKNREFWSKRGGLQ